MNYLSLLNYLYSLADKKFADFSKTLSNSDYICIGVKVPMLRQIIKQHINDKELSLDDFELGRYLELDFIYFGLGLSRISNIDEQLSFIVNNINNVKSWVITDMIGTFIKRLGFEKYWDFMLDNVKDDYIYHRRVVYVLALKFCRDKRILNILSYIKENEEYMVMMSEAWLLASIAIFYPLEIYDYLKCCNDKLLKRKTISKIVDSYRISSEDKTKFKSLR